MLRAKERNDLNELVKIKRKKAKLIDRLTQEKEESKYRSMEQKILQETMRGERRAHLSLNL